MTAPSPNDARATASGSSRETAPVRLRPIVEGDVEAVACFLHEHMETSIGVAEWRRVIDVRWSDGPNSGYMLVAGDSVVGAYLAHYVEREIDGKAERFCNLGTWCVLPEHRLHSLRLLRALLAQEGCHFTDLTPNSQAAAVNRRLGFVALPATTRVMPAIPWPSVPGRTRVFSDPARIEERLTGGDRTLFDDHRDAPAVIHVLLERDGRSCYVVGRPVRRHGLRVARVLHVGDPAVFARASRPFARHLLLRHGVVAYATDEQIVRHRPLISLASAGQERMLKSDTLDPSRVDYLYSELVTLPT